jgi:hypothetical protein
MKTIVALAALLLLICQPACALTFNDAADNLLYFEYAKQSADYCEQRGYPSRQILAAWQLSNEPIHRRSLETMRNDPKFLSLPGEEQTRVLSEVDRVTQKKVRDHLARRSVPCHKFRTFLDGFSNLLKR